MYSYTHAYINMYTIVGYWVFTNRGATREPEISKCVCTYIHTYIYIYTYTHANLYNTYIRIYIYIHTCVYIYTYTHAHVHMRTNAVSEEFIKEVPKGHEQVESRIYM